MLKGTLKFKAICLLLIMQIFAAQKILAQSQIQTIGMDTQLSSNINTNTNINNKPIQNKLNPNTRKDQRTQDFSKSETKQFVNLDAQLLNIYLLIQKKNTAQASILLNDLLKMYPNFQLAQGLKLALSNNQTSTKLEKDLRHEAEVRIASIIKPVDKKAIPQSFLQMARWQKTGMVVDAYSARLYMYENIKGRPKYLFDNYITIGKNGMIKKREGDYKTPIGIYHLEKFMPRASLPELYGFGAMPLNFPNKWDDFNKIGGSNIWIHGVPYNTYSRAPLSSRGCVALSNKDLEDLFKFSQVDKTPVAINTKHQWLDFKSWEQQQLIAKHLFKQWLINYNLQQQQKKPETYTPLFIDLQDVAMYSYANLGDIKKQHTAESFLEFNGDNLEKLVAEDFSDKPQKMLIGKSSENNPSQSVIDQMSSLLMFEFFVNSKRIWQYWQKTDSSWRLIYTNL